MSGITVSQGSLWPYPLGVTSNNGITTGGNLLLNAAPRRCAYMGRVFIAGRATSKTLSAAGNGQISFGALSVTWANGGTNLDIGLQGISTSAGPPCQPDGSFTVKKSCVPGTTTISTGWNTITMGSGTVTLSNGDLVAIVFDMTARAGTDAVTVQSQSETLLFNFPIAATFNGSTWSGQVGSQAAIVLTFDDGTLGCIYGASPISSTATTDSFNSSSNPEERGILFTVPADCYVDGLWGFISVTDGSSGYTLELFDKPTTAASLLASVAVDPHMHGSTLLRFVMHSITPTQLRANREYGVAVLATGSTSVSMNIASVAATAHMGLWYGGTVNGTTTCGNGVLLQKITRHGSSGQFEFASNTSSYVFGVRIMEADFANQLVNSGALVG